MCVQLGALNPVPFASLPCSEDRDFRRRLVQRQPAVGPTHANGGHLRVRA